MQIAELEEEHAKVRIRDADDRAVTIRALQEQSVAALRAAEAAYKAERAARAEDEQRYVAALENLQAGGGGADEASLIKSVAQLQDALRKSEDARTTTVENHQKEVEALVRKKTERKQRQNLILSC